MYRAAFFGGFDTLKSYALSIGFGAAVWQVPTCLVLCTVVQGLGYTD